MSVPSFSHYLAEAAAAQARTQSSWNDRLAHWERPASDSEEEKIERAATMVRSALAGNTWLKAEGVTINPQGSYHNNTNVRLDADMDLRAQHPSLRVEYHSDVVKQAADAVLGFYETGHTFGEVGGKMRAEITKELSSAFTASNVDDTGNKAIRVKGLPGSRSEVDVVPAFRLMHVTWMPTLNRYHTVEGVAILAKNTGGFTLNFPEQHYKNGVAKGSRTKLRFKRNVRILKRLRNDLIDSGALHVKIPSFLVECLVYGVEDRYFLQEEDDRYDRARRIVARLAEQLSNSAWVSAATEINEVKRLFHAQQPWKSADVLAFVNAAHSRLEA